jgi:hypothetical protein
MEYIFLRIIIKKKKKFFDCVFTFFLYFKKLFYIIAQTKNLERIHLPFSFLVDSFWKVNSGKMNFRKMNYFPMFGSVMKNKLENIFQCLLMSWKMS